MTESRKCGKCGVAIAVDARWGACAKCLLEPGMEAPFKTSFDEEDRRVADYELGRQIGRGGMGVVYEATQVSLRRTVALKMIVDSQASSPTALRRFAIEAEAAAKLDHPNIVPIYEIGEHRNQPFLSMKLVHGESLRQKLRGQAQLAAKGQESKSSSRECIRAAAELMAKVARAVHHAHQNGVLHRDLKPGNILIDREGEPHLTDFGLAKFLNPAEGDHTPLTLTNSSAILGTPSYMSPEQVLNQPLSAASDVYGLGAILFELLTGEPPFKANTILETVRLVCEQEPKSPRSENRTLDSDLETVCLKCLEKRPDARYSSALAVAEDLERWLRQEPIHARRAGVASRLQRWVRRNPVGAGLIVSLCACLSVTLVLLRMKAMQEEQDRYTMIWAGEKLVKQIEGLWDNKDQTCITIVSSELAALANFSQRGPPSRPFVELKFAMTIDEAPVAQAIECAPFLRHLEMEMAKSLKQQVFIDLWLYKTRSWADPGVGRGEVDVQKLSPLTYLRLREAGTSVSPVVRQRQDREAVIFARGNLGISTLSQVRGHKVAFAHTNSIVSSFAKVNLARAGICRNDLAAHEDFESSLFRNQPEPRNYYQNEGPSDADDYAHREAINQVLTGPFEIGVAPRQRFERQKVQGKKLIELHRFQVPTDLLVARPGLDAKIVLAFQQSLASLDRERNKSHKKLMISLGRTLLGFEAVNDRSLDDVRNAMTNELKQFECCGSSSPPVTSSAPQRTP